MSAQPPGRRTESLFDNRYRYDHIYPRGRSGETLRAYDTLDGDRPVVIKRPAPQDAPPMRAGQEISIRTERQALERLAGHPVLTELRGSGSFRVGGHTHEYIVMDLAQGEIVEQMVLERAARGEYLPELETLVIVDRLLDLLSHAHNRQVIYNDVDAKHLFWDRNTYRLKVIDWGNAVFLDEPGALPSVSRATDIHQCGELLFFILTGGSRLAVEVEDGGETFFIAFGPHTERIPARMQAILTRAVHPDPRQRFGTVLELRSALADYRQPLEKARDEIIARVRKRVRPTASQEELEDLRAQLQTALEMDPGFPDATRLAQEIAQHIQQIRFQADLDAIRIYLESANWARALGLLHDLQPDAAEMNLPLIRFLMAATTLLDDLQVAPPPAGFLAALDPLFGGNVAHAGLALLTTPEGRASAQLAQWLLAEQLTVHLPQVVLLRPHLVALRHRLAPVAGAAPVLDLLEAIDAELARPPLSGLTGLQVIYQQVAALLTRLEPALEQAAPHLDASLSESASASIERAQQAVGEILRCLDEIGRCAYGDPQRAGDLLHRARMIHPTAAHFDALHHYFDEVHQAIQALSQFRPRANGSNLSEWFADVHEFIQPYLQDLADAQLHGAAQSILRAAESWATVTHYLALGRRQPTIDVLHQAADVIRPVNEQIAAWLGTLANRLPDTAYAERLSPNEPLADLLIEGWKAWDRGDGIRAAELGRQAQALAHSEGERLAAERLRRLSDILDRWVAAGGCEHAEQTDQAESQTLAVLLPDEEEERQRFSAQMPNTALYLRAMNRGIVAFMHQSSSAGWRALYLHYVLRGMLALFDNQLEESEFWREVASRSYEGARTHRAFQVFDRALTSRLLIQKAQRALNAVTRPSDLDAVRQAINVPLAGDVLGGAEQAVLQVQDALRHWTDGDFYTARQALDNALKHLEHAAAHTALDVTSFADWVSGLHAAADELQQARLTVERAAAAASDTPDPAIGAALATIVERTQQHLGQEHAHQVRQWQEMYQAVLETYTTQRLTRTAKLDAFNRHFASLFITRHPAYPLFRHWQLATEQLPPDVTEDHHIDLETEVEADESEVVSFADDASPRPSMRRARSEPGGLPWNWIIVGALVLLMAGIVLAVLRSRNDGAEESVVGAGTAPASPVGIVGPAASPTPAATLSPAALAVATTITPPPVTTSPAMLPSPSATPTATATAFSIPTTPAVTPTEVLPPTSTPTLFVTSTLLPTRTLEPTPELLPTAAAEPDVLAALARLPAAERPGPQGAFAPGTGSAWVLTTAGAPGGMVEITLSPELLGTLFQPGAASALRRIDATFELLNPDALSQGEVAFGLGAVNTDREKTIGQAVLREGGFVSLGLNQNGRFRAVTEFPQQNPALELSIRRTNANTLSFFVDDRLLGDSVYLFPQNEPLGLILYVSGRNVVVEVKAFAIDFSPRDIIP